MQYVRRHWFGICIFFIIILAAILRFYNFENRWGLAYDQARDVLVAREALRTHSIPLIGPFASAGQFVYGPQWYWILMVMIGVYPYSIITPWIAQAFLYVAVVLLMIIIGKEIVSRWFGLLIGLLTAISPAQVTQATNLTSPSMVGVITVVSLYFLVKYVKTGKTVHAFWMAFAIGNAVNVHFQAVGLLIVIPIAFIFDKKKSLKKIFILLTGIIIPFIPLIIFDVLNNFFESKNMMQYYLHDQYKISFDVLGRRWLTYVSVFWSNAWAYIVGGYSAIGYIVVACLATVTIYKFLKKTIQKELHIFIISFLSMFILIRYTRTPLFYTYLVSMNYFVLILTGWAIFAIYKRNIFLGIILLIIVIAGSVVKDFEEIKAATNNASLRSEHWKNLLIRTYKDKKFAIYDHGYRSTSSSLPLVLFLDENKKISDNGYKIGFSSKPKVAIQSHKEIKGNKIGFVLYDLNSSSSAELREDGWAFINPSQIYRSTVEWYKREKL